MGAHLTKHQGVDGVSFAVWAPNASRVNIVGDFNGWDGRSHPMENIHHSGYWNLFIPHILAGTHYKFELKDIHGKLRMNLYLYMQKIVEEQIMKIESTRQ